MNTNQLFKMKKTFILTAIGYGHVTEVYRNESVVLVQAEKKRLKAQSQWKMYHFEIRTVEGFKAKPILKG